MDMSYNIFNDILLSGDLVEWDLKATANFDKAQYEVFSWKHWLDTMLFQNIVSIKNLITLAACNLGSEF